MEEGEQRQPAADVLQPDRHRPDRRRGRLPGRRRPPPDARWRQDHRDRRRRTDSRRRACHLDQSGQPAARADWQRRRSRRVVRPRQDVGVPAEPAGRALLPRQLRHGDPVQRLRRDAGQLQLVRSERSPRRRRDSQPCVEHAPGWRRLPRPSRSDRLPRRLQRIPGRQHRPRRSRDRRDDEREAAARPGRAGAALALGHAAPPLAARSEGRLRGCQQGVPIARSRSLVGARSAPT